MTRNPLAQLGLWMMRGLQGRASASHGLWQGISGRPGRGTGWLAIVLAAGLLSACTTVPVEDESTAPKVSFTNTIWRLVHVGGNKVAPPEPDGQAPFIIFLDDGRVGGFAGCNHFKGTYAVVNGEFRFTEMAATRDVCPDDPVEGPYMKAMRQTVGVKQDNDELLLLNKSGQPLAVLKAQVKRLK